MKNNNPPTECPYCHTELLKGHSCPGAKEDCKKAVKQIITSTETDLRLVWRGLKFQQDCDRDQGGITWRVHRSEREWAEIAKDFDKYIKEAK